MVFFWIFRYWYFLLLKLISKNMSLPGSSGIGDGGGGKKRKRTTYSDEFKEAFRDMYENFKGGKFKRIVEEQSTTSNLVKSDFWVQFTGELNRRCGSDYSKANILNYYHNMSRKIRADTNEIAQISAARKVSQRTGGGPAEPEPAQADGDLMAAVNTLGIPAVRPNRDNNSTR